MTTNRSGLPKPRTWKGTIFHPSKHEPMPPLLDDDAAIDAAVDRKIAEDEAAFEEQYAAEHPDEDYLGRPA